MFENRSEKQQIAIFAVIGIVVALVLSVFHYFQGFHPYYIVIAANIEFFCVFYILYLPLKVKKAREKQQNSKK